MEGIPDRIRRLSSTPSTIRLLVILLLVVVNNVEELELVHAPGGRDDTEPVAELHLLEELLGPVVVLSVVVHHGA